MGIQEVDKAGITNLSSFAWSIAEILRGDFNSTLSYFMNGPVQAGFQGIFSPSVSVMDNFRKIFWRRFRAWEQFTQCQYQIRQ